MRTLRDLFIDELGNIYSSEQQIAEILPNLINAASLPELKKTLSAHQQETEQHITRLEKIFSHLDLDVSENHCLVMERLLNDTHALLKQNKIKSTVLDAAIIMAARKIDHYEIATYGSLSNLARHLDIDEKIPDLIQENLNDEDASDKKLTKIADEALSSEAINQNAAQAKYPSRRAAATK